VGRQQADVLVPVVSGLKRVGHKGADLIVPGNTPASFDAALAAGVDMIEFDVLPEDCRAPGSSRLLLAHDYERDLADATPLEAGLEDLTGPRFANVELDVDLKLPGYEREVVEGLARHGLIDRSLVSTMYVESLDRLGELQPGLRRGWSVPRVRRNYLRSPWAVPAYALARYMRARMPSIAARRIRTGGCEAIMAHRILVSRRLVRAVQRAGGQLYVWTVDDPRRIRALEALGVDGVITNDPRLFDAG
jgi:glycerophosphoryl diester phosphodiesterase